MTSSSSPSTPSATRMTARTPEDLLAVVPVVLGFEPEDSVVMLTFGARDPFHARVDLPPPEHAREVLDVLLAPALEHHVERVVLVLYAGQARPAEQVGRALAFGFRGAGIDVVDLIRADGQRWFPLLREPRDGEEGVPYDLSTHPFAAQAVFDGRVTHGSRAALAATLEPDPDAVARVEAVLRESPGQPEASPPWVSRTVARLAESGEAADDTTAARLLVAVAEDLSCRDAAWLGLTRAGARRHVELWTGLVRRAPDRVAAGAAAVLALAAWLSGHGALAWCAVDRAEALEPGHSLAALVSDLLSRAVPPSAWPAGEDLHGRAEPA